MKKYSFLAILILLLVLATSCQNQPVEKTTFENAVYTKIPLNFEMTELQSETCCYVDDENMLFTVGTRNNNNEGIGVYTDYILLYNYNKGEVSKKYDVKSKGYIMSAVPYKDGVLYVDYDGNLADVKWQIKFMNDDGTLTLHEGECSSYAHTPSVKLIDGTPVYIWQDTPGGKNEYGINKIIDMETINIFSDKENILNSIHFLSNSKEYLFFMKKLDAFYGTLVVGDLDGVRFTYDLEDKISDYGITKDYVVLSMAKSMEERYHLRFNISDGKFQRSEVGRELYFSGLEDNTCLCVDFSFNRFHLDLDSEKRVEVPLPEEFMGGNHSTYFMPVNKDKCIVEFGLEGEDVYYVMEKDSEGIKTF